MEVTAITEIQGNESFRRNNFIRLSNRYMSVPETPNPVDQAQEANRKLGKLGIENLQEFTIFPREVIDGRTIITA